MAMRCRDERETHTQAGIFQNISDTDVGLFDPYVGHKLLLVACQPAQCDCSHAFFKKKQCFWMVETCFALRISTMKVVANRNDAERKKGKPLICPQFQML